MDRSEEKKGVRKREPLDASTASLNIIVSLFLHSKDTSVHVRKRRP